MDKNLLILGAGGYGFVVKEIAEALGIYKKIDFLDDGKDFAIGSFSQAAEFRSDYEDAIVAVGNPQLRSALYQSLLDAGFTLPSLVHPRAWVSPSATLGRGCVIEPCAVVNPRAVLEEACYVSAGAVVNHDAFVGACSHVDCNATVAAGKTLPSGSKLASPIFSES